MAKEFVREILEKFNNSGGRKTGRRPLPYAGTHDRDAMDFGDRVPELPISYQIFRFLYSMLLKPETSLVWELIVAITSTVRSGRRWAGLVA
ncbi:hypothetical protein AiwAL_14415 [Acidiphilium sp. AL]|uniref:Uncharacterized protein n=1 Tax=Acidiphilium iwatense TaxID=768198 RepID=A0ABS9E3W6_9PROT|nr:MULTISPECIES: hypothetical protein [Acidiphilium]MCF3948342.1 hypothetical protein [Acidiphilium iwatense]MCU4161283.1 hypothetical protein [Acidiphilium sp. AL]